jgi:hypothetical protein
VRSEALKPRPWRLLESIGGLAQETVVVRACWIHEAGRLLAVHGLSEVAMKERVLDVEVVNDPVTGGRQMRRWLLA